MTDSILYLTNFIHYYARWINNFQSTEYLFYNKLI